MYLVVRLIKSTFMDKDNSIKKKKTVGELVQYKF